MRAERLAMFTTSVCKKQREKFQRTKILNQDLVGGHDGLFGADLSSAVLQGLLGLRVEEADAVVVANAGLAGDNLLDILDGGGGGDLNGLGELLDGLLGS